MEPLARTVEALGARVPSEQADRFRAAARADHGSASDALRKGTDL